MTTAAISSYREFVDFKEHIGTWKNKEGGSLPTTKGIIHYSRNGAHIIPAYPGPADTIIPTRSSLMCSLQVALLGAITENLRAVSVSFHEKNITVFFYYAKQPSNEEEDISEVVISEVLADFVDACVISNRVVLPKVNKIPEIGLKIFHKKED